MKKNILLIIVTVYLMLMPSLVNASSVSVSLNCPSSATQGSTLQCKINVTSDVAVNGISGNFNLNGLTFSNLEAQSGFTIYNSSASGFALGNTSGKSGNFTVAVVNLNVGNAGSISLLNLDVSDTNYNSYSPSSNSNSIRLKSTNTDLAGLSLSSGILSPAFSVATTNYTATIDADSVVINATKGDNYQTISGIGAKTLNYGSNTFNIVVTAESGSTKTYTIVITRPDNRNTNNYLKTLTVSEGSISFDKNTTSYSLSVDSNTTSVMIGATLEDSTASFLSGYGARKVNLNYGKNEILVKVKAENGSTKTYTIIVNRKDDRSTNNYLKAISLSDGNISFNKETLEYNTSVDYDVTKLEVNVQADDEKSKVVIDNTDLVVGDNVLKIKVTAENGTERTYTINVKRLSEAEKMSDNNNVISISIFGHNFKFSKDVSEYDITISSEETELFFNVLLEDESANYNIEGNENLEDGSIVTVTSISESGIEKKYKFLISKEVIKETNQILIYIIISIIFLVLGFVLGYYFRNIKNKISNKIKK